MKDIKNLKSVVLGGIGAGSFCGYLEGVGVKDASILSPHISVPEITKTVLAELLMGVCSAEAFYCIFEDNDDRATFLEWARELGYATPTFVHQTAEVDPTLQLDPNAGIYILEKAKIESDVGIGRFSLIAGKARIAEGVRIGNAVTISARVNLGENVVAEDSVTIEEDVTVKPGRILRQGCTVRKGLVVTEDVPVLHILSGDPAEIQKGEEESS